MKWTYSGLHIGRLRINFHAGGICDEYEHLYIVNPFNVSSREYKWHIDVLGNVDRMNPWDFKCLTIAWWHFTWQVKR